MPTRVLERNLADAIPLLTDNINACASVSQASLLVELEMQAFWHGSRIAVAPLDPADHRAGLVYSYARPVLGLGVGIRDGVVLLGPTQTTLCAVSLSERLAELAPADVASFRVASPEPLALPQERPRAFNRRALRAVTVRRNLQEVLALGPDYTAFLQTLGRSTRRNVRQCARMADKHELILEWSTSGITVRRRELAAICRANMPTPASARRTASVVRLIDGQERPFHAALRDREGRLISVAGGFLVGGTAFLLYQYNDRALRKLNPSLIMRCMLIARAVGDGVRHIAFVGRCSGLLLHACQRLPAAELMIVRQTHRARLKQLACMVAKPHSQIARMSRATRTPQPASVSHSVAAPS